VERSFLYPDRLTPMVDKTFIAVIAFLVLLLISSLVSMVPPLDIGSPRY
jgi:hypothetical protein